MRQKPYYSVRNGKHPTAGKLDLQGMKHLLLAVYQEFTVEGHFQLVFGSERVDAGFISGSAG